MRLLLDKQLEASAGRGATACNNTDGRLVWGSEVEIGGSDQEGAWGLFYYDSRGSSRLLWRRPRGKPTMRCDAKNMG